MPPNKIHTSKVQPEQKYLLAKKRHPNWTRLVAEGDSWFDFPNYLPQKRNDVMNWLRSDAFRYVVCNFATMGHELKDMVRKKEYMEIIGRKSGGHYAENFKCLLFSAGGNDILGKPLKKIVKQSDGTMRGNDLINRAELNAARDEIERYFRLLYDMVQAARPGLPVVVHGYDYAIPSRKAVRLFWRFKVSGPWILPTLEKRNVRDKADQIHVVRVLIDAVNEVHAKLAGELRHYVRVDCRGTLGPDDWGDEIHPTSSGFRKIAEQIDAAIRAL